MPSFRSLIIASIAMSLGLCGAVSGQGTSFFDVEFDRRPSLRVGSFLNVDLRVKAQADVQRISPEYETDEGTFDLNRFRLGLDGELLNHLEFQVERELRGELQERGSKYPWRDAWINWKTFPQFQFRAGKFKVPFGMEELTSVSDLNFGLRARLSDDLAPGRDIGAAIHGEFSTAQLQYEAGIFRDDGENSDSNADIRGGRTISARVTAEPLRLIGFPGDWDEVQIGIAAASSDVGEGLNSLRGRTVGGDVYFPHVFVKGRRFRFGTEASWRPGPFSIQAEFIQVQERREGQSVRGDDLPLKISQGWYMEGTWAVTGESKENGINPRRPLFTEGFGAVELGLRYEQIVFRSASREGIEFRSPRAPNLWSNGDRVWTAGVNWYLNRYVRIQMNGIHETIQDPERGPIPGRRHFTTALVRFQFSM